MRKTRKKNDSSTPIASKIKLIKNIDDYQILISQTKLENILLKRKEVFNSGSDWKSPLGNIIAITLVLVTADFKSDFLGISRQTLNVIFIVLLFVNCAGFVMGIFRFIKEKRSMVKLLIEEIRNDVK